MPSPLRWGVLGAARIAINRVIPGMRGSVLARVDAIAARDLARAQAAAAALGIARAYGSYETLLADPEIDVVYVALPNHLHAEWAIRAAEAGKHVLCEKPLALSAAEARTIVEARDRTGVRVQEAFMVRTHPQWERAVSLCREGALGDVCAYNGTFSFFNDRPADIRNIAAFGGGGIMDIGCYLVMTSRLVFGASPVRVVSDLRIDPTAGVDTLASMILEYPAGAHATGMCSTRLVPQQRVQIFGTRARLEIEIPFNAPPDRPCRLWLDDGRDVFGGGRQELLLPVCNQYRLQADRFSESILDGSPQPYALEESLANLEVIDAIFRSNESRGWERVGT